MASGPFTIPSIAHGFEYNRSGQIKTLGDPSGSRSLDYQNGRLSATTYTAGLLKGYAIIPGRDTSGRQTGTLIKRYGATIHSTQKAPNGASDQITNLASGNITATPQRDGAGRITGYVWSNGTNSVSQTWTRGTGGRIEFAGSNVTGAPSFNYASFDGFGRRLKCTTEGGSWAYTYGVGGQLTSAIHKNANDQVILGDFTYAFDGIGRRLEKGPVGADPNTTDVLNRTTAWTNSQNKTLTIHADPAARVWYNGTEIQNFTGTHSATITPPGAAGGWVPWNTLAVLEGAGEGAGNPAVNPLASPDAKAEKKGAVWVPPTAETLTYDAAGNRQSSAQWDFGWDGKNQLARARTKDYNTAPQGWDITFTYDAEGRRVKKHVIEYQAGVRVSEKIVTFVWDNWELLYERHQLPSGLTTLERKYLWGPDIADGAAGGAGGLLLIRETKGNTTTEIIPLYEGTGHVAALTNINKDLLASYAYGPFGEKITATGPKANSNPWRFQTKYLDEETGLYYFGKRYYDPITGQWLSREPLGESESVNLYTLAGNDPVNHVDKLGLATVAVNGGLSTSLDSIFGILTGDFLPEPESTTTVSLETTSPNDLTWLSYVADYVEANALPLPEIDWSADHSIDLWAMNAPLRELDKAADMRRFDARTTEMLRLTSQGRSNGEADFNLASGTTNGVLFFTNPEAGAFKVIAAGFLAIKGLRGVKMIGSVARFGDEAVELERVAEGGDDLITFYHGTKNPWVGDGFDISRARAKVDFGKGFYTTTDPAQAAIWAGKTGVVLEFKVPRSALAGLNSLDMGLATQSSLFRFFRHNRLGGRLHSYDTVSGTMLREVDDFLEGGARITSGQQTSWHTQESLDLIWSYRVR